MNLTHEVQPHRMFLTCGIAVFALCACVAHRISAEDAREPARRELWVPTRDLDEVLRRHPNAVLLDRAQYEALIRDAGIVKPDDAKPEPPVGAVVEGAKLNAELVGGARRIVIRATVSVNVLGDGWAEARLLDLPEGIVMTKFNGSDVLYQETASGKAARGAVLAVRGRGRHEVAMEFHSPLRRKNRICTATLPLLGRPCSVTATPLGSAEVPEHWMMRGGVAMVPVVPPGGDATGMSITWTERAAADAAPRPLIFETADCRASVDGSGVTSDVRIHLRSVGGPLPKVLKFALARGDANVVAVDDLNVASWRQEGAVLEIVGRNSLDDELDYHVTTVGPPPDGGGSAPVVIEVPRLEGAARVAANLGLSVADEFEMTGWQLPGAAPDEAFANDQRSRKAAADGSFATHYDVVPDTVIANVRRRGNRFSADVDNRIALSTHDVTMERGIALRGEEGRVSRAMFTVPAGEQFLGLGSASGEPVEWKQLQGSSFELVWPGGLRKGQSSILSLKTRRDLDAGTAEGRGTESLAFENLKLPEAIRVAGYVTLDFDDSWKVVTTGTAGLESRDARVTPVKGRMAWFTLRDHTLGIDIARNEPVLDAGVIAYALPRAKNVEIEGQIVLEVSRAPLRKLDVTLPVATARLLRWDSPLIGGQALDPTTGTWHLALRKELLGVANMRFHLSLAAEQKQQAADETRSQEPGTKNQTALAATLPNIELPAARRFNGAWVVEANTDTELSYETKGMQPLDALRAPVVEGYTPRHRVLAAYAYGSGARDLRITATRHEPGALVSAIVNEFKITSVIGRDGVSRHEAALLVRHNGRQFFDIRLPRGAVLLGARAADRAVKPVRAGEDEVRVPLPVNRSADAPVWIAVTYELMSPAWGGGGRVQLIPPGVGDGVPVLATSWRVHAPDGYSFAEPETKLGGAFRDTARSTLAARWAGLIGRRMGRFLSIGHLDRAAVSAPVPEAPGKKQIPGAEEGKADMPLPKPSFVGKPAAVPAPAIREKTEQSLEPLAQQKVAIGAGKPGLISLEIDVPVAGRMFKFHGNQRPDVITLHYESWERQMLQSALWFLLGLLLFFLVGRRRALVLTIAVALLFTCVPVVIAPAWIWACNAVFAGWLAGFIAWLAWRVARWIEAKFGAWITRPEPGGFAVLLAVCFACFADRSHAGEKPDPAAHTVIVPYELSQPRDPRHANRYYLDYAEFQRLWELAKENRRPVKPGDADGKGPPEAFINSALHDVRITDDKLIIAARFSVFTRGAKWARLPLPFKGDGLTMAEVKLDGGTALLEKGDVFIENPGVHAVEVALQVHRGRGWKEAAIEIPRSPSALVTIAAPASEGRPILGGAVENALVTEEMRGGLRVLTMPLGNSMKLSVTRTPGRKLAAASPPAQADTRLSLRVLPRIEKVSAEVTFNFAGSERNALTVDLDSSLRLESVESVPAAEAVLRREGEGQFIDLHFPQTIVDRAVVTLRAERVFGGATGERTVPSVLGRASRRASVIEVQSGAELRIAVDAAGADSYRVAADQQLRYVVTNAEDRSRSRVEAVHQFTAQKAEIIAAVTLDTGREPLASARIGVPPGFEVQTLTGPRVKSWHLEDGVLVVRFDSEPQREAKLVAHLARTLAQPASTWKLEPLKLPQFAKHEGAILIATHAADDLKLAFDGADRKLREVDPAGMPSVVSVALPFQVKRALAVEKPDWNAEVTLTRQAPRFSADTVLLARAGDVALSFSQQIGLAVEQGVVGSVKVRLPKSLPEARVHGAMVREAQSRIAGESREYDVSFQTGVLDRVSFTMDVDLPLEGETSLPSVQVDGATRVGRFVIVDNAGAREMKLDPGGAEAAVKESLPYLPEGLVRPEFLRPGATSAVKLSFTQLESTAGNAAIIALAEITTALRPDGERWETLVYSLANRSLQFLPVKLPEGAELVEVSVSGRTVRADLAGAPNSYLVPLIRMRAGELSQQVKLVYRFHAAQEIERAHRFRQPELIGLSAERTLWNVWVPEGFTARRIDGNMEEIGRQGRELEKLRSDLSDIARLNRALTGGNLSREELLYCWDNINAKLAEVRKLREDSRTRSRGRPDEGADRAAEEKLRRVLGQLDSDVERQIRQQGELIASNSGIATKARQYVAETVDQIRERVMDYGKLMAEVEKLTKEHADPGVGVEARIKRETELRGKTEALRSLDREINDLKGRRPQAVQGWALNKEAPQQAAAAWSQVTTNYARSGMVDLNDNISLNGGEFFKAQAGAIAGAGGLMKTGDGVWAPIKSGAGALTLTTGGAGPAQQADAGNFNASNARAGQGVQLARQSQTDRVGVTTDTARFGAANLPGSRPAAGGDSADRSGFRTDEEGRNMAITPQLNPIGRVSLAVDVPLDGVVYHFSKLKDHALIEFTVVKPFSKRQTGVMWVLGVGLILLLLSEVARRGRRGRACATAL